MREGNHLIRVAPSPTVTRPRSGARFPGDGASRSRTAKGHKATPEIDDDGAADEVVVIDPVHPLYRRRFRLVGIVRAGCSDGIARVEYRFGLTLLLPLPATSLWSGDTSRTAPTKLTRDALEELLTLAEASEEACPSSLETSGTACRRRFAGRSRTISPRS